MLNADQLFAQVQVEADPGMTTPSPGALGEYVLGMLPGHLQEIRECTMAYTQLSSIQADVLADARQDIMGNTDPLQAASTQLDLLFILGGYLPLGTEAYRVTPAELHAHIGHNYEHFGTPPRMRYEQIVDLNAAEFFRSGIVRTYFPLSTDVGKDERDFYIGHFMAEPLVNTAYRAVEHLLDGHGMVDEKDIAKFVNQQMREFTLRMARYARLGADRFNAFRQYLVEYPEGARNASGAFLPSVQQFELVMRHPTVNQAEYLAVSMDYFPQKAQPVIQRLVEKSEGGKNLVDMLDTGEVSVDGDTLEELIGAAESFQGFKFSHMRVTKSKVAGLIEGEVTRDELDKAVEASIFAPGKTGTGGFNATNVLTNGYVRARDLKKELVARRV